MYSLSYFLPCLLQWVFVWEHICFLGMHFFLDVYSPTAKTVSWFINYGLLIIRNSFPFVSKSILSWYSIKKYSSRLFHYTFLENILVISPLQLHIFIYSMLCYIPWPPFYKNTLLHKFTLPHAPPPCLQGKRLKSSANRGARTLRHLLSNLLSKMLTLIFAHSCPPEVSLEQNQMIHIICLLVLPFPHDKIRNIQKKISHFNHRTQL